MQPRLTLVEVRDERRVRDVPVKDREGLGLLLAATDVLREASLCAGLDIEPRSRTVIAVGMS